MSGDMDLLVRSLSAVSRLLASSPLSKYISSSLVADVQWWTATLVDLGVIPGSRVVCKSTAKSDVPCSMCKGTGDWHERGVPAFGAKWLKCPRCKGEQTESIVSLIPGRKVIIGDESLIVVDFSNDPVPWNSWNDVPGRLNGGYFDCPTLAEAGRALAELSRFSLATPRLGQLTKSASYMLDLSQRLEYCCLDDDCNRIGGVIKDHVGILVGACCCWSGGCVARDVIPDELHEWLWIEHALRLPVVWNYLPQSLYDKRGGLDHLQKNYKLRKIGSWLDEVSR